MKLATLPVFPPDRTLRDMHIARGDALFAAGPHGCDTLLKYLGDSWAIIWRDDRGVACQHIVTNDAAAGRVALFVREHGCLPPSARRSRRPTLRGLACVEAV